MITGEVDVFPHLGRLEGTRLSSGDSPSCGKVGGANREAWHGLVGGAGNSFNFTCLPYAGMSC